MKLSLDSVGYGGYFTKDHVNLSMEEAFGHAAKLGYDAVCIYAHRPIGFPLDFDENRRKGLRGLAEKLDLEIGAIVACTNFMKGNHSLVYPQEKEILYVRECIDFAKDMNVKIVRILAAFFGYFQNLYAGQGYGAPAFESRSRRVSRNEDWLETWHDCVEGIREVAKYAKDKGVTLALQTHPEITGNNDETLEMIDEIGVDSVKVGLDLPLFESQDPDFVRATVRKMKGMMVYSHTISIAGYKTVGGAPYRWEEVAPGSPNDPCKWEVFIAACKEIGYDGYLSHEICSPVVVKGHKLGDIAEIDRRYLEAREYLKGLLKKLGCYGGHKN
jgi:sugar phosphate isomerase/epimerase